MPSFAHSEYTEDHVISRFVVAAEGLGAPQVTDRVDAPGDVVDEEDARQPAPDEAEEGTGPTHGEQAAQDGGDQESDEHPDGKGVADPPQDPALHQVGNVVVDLGLILVEEPTDVRIPQAL